MLVLEPELPGAVLGTTRNRLGVLYRAVEEEEEEDGGAAGMMSHLPLLAE